PEYTHKHKHFLFFFLNENIVKFLFQASGVALITIGVLQYSTYTQIGTFAGGGLSKIAIVLIAVGVTIALISLLGHVGAFINNSSMVTCVSNIIFHNGFGVNLPFFFLFFLQWNMYRNRSTNTSVIWCNPHVLYTMSQFSCCGADSYEDWSESVGWENHDAVPDSCCVVKISYVCAHPQGCTWAIKLFLLKNLVWVGAVCIALGVLFGVLVGVCLCLDIKGKNYENFS
uniref:Uncharacterized protein n=1 Tax=Seriola dumerili TaxID=41447 RepID=A0A3B4VDY6_SERDU